MIALFSSTRSLNCVVTQQTDIDNFFPIRIATGIYAQQQQKIEIHKTIWSSLVGLVEVGFSFPYSAHWWNKSGGTNPALLSTNMLSFSPMPFWHPFRGSCTGAPKIVDISVYLAKRLKHSANNLPPISQYIIYECMHSCKRPINIFYS